VADLRAALDAVDGARLAARAAANQRWAALVGDAARRAPGGRAAWIGPRDGDVPLPDGFAWIELPAVAAASLPSGGSRLVVATGPGLAAGAARLAALLEPGGILLASTDDPAPFAAAGLRIVELHRDAPVAVLARRDP
jgi:hypothetical protein